MEPQMASVSPADAARGRADWRRVEKLYEQLSAIANDPEKINVPPDVLTGSLAESMSRLFAHYDGCERQFMDDVFEVFGSVDRLTGTERDRFVRLYYDERFERFSAYNPPGSERRRPKPFEAAIETCRRLIDINHIRDALVPAVTTSGILGGSVSYGRFFNVCGAARGGKASDTDLLLVLPNYDQLPDVADAIERVQGMDINSIAFLKRRLPIFHDVRARSNPCIFSHKLVLWEDRSDPYLQKYHLPGRYVLSIHVFSWDDFRYLILNDRSILTASGDGTFVRTIYDYRETEPTRVDNQRSFSGIDSSVPLEAHSVELGYLSKVRICHIENDRYYPGLHQNLILPQFEIRWESPNLRLYLPMLGFRWKVLERLNEERRIRPFEIQRLSLCHTRSAVFSPHIVRRCDRE
jgi:hypothetical protein